MNKDIYVSIYINEINTYAKDYEVVQVFTEKIDNVEFTNKEQVGYGYASNTTGGPTVQVPIVRTLYATKVLMKLKRTQEILYGETK